MGCFDYFVDMRIPSMKKGSVARPVAAIHSLLHNPHLQLANQVRAELS